MRSSRSLLAALLVATACGSGVNDLTIAAAPLVTVHGHVDLSQIPAEVQGVPLRAVLMWGAVPDYVLACVKYKDNLALQQACPDPFSFVPGQVEADVAIPLDGDGSFEISLMRLPDTNITVASNGADIAWGSILVAADIDRNGAFNLGIPGSRHSGSSGSADQLLAASFYSLRDAQQRLGFREGGWDDQSTFYPLRGCVAPPPGFFVLGTPGLQADLTPNPGVCAATGLDATVIEAAPLTTEQARVLRCAAFSNSSVTQPTADSPVPAGAGPLDPAFVCLDPLTVAVIEPGDCPSITVMPLAGCEGDLLCQQPEWDITATPPTWWPCGT